MAQFAAQMIYHLVADACTKDRQPRVGVPHCDTNCDILDDNGGSVIGTYSNAMRLDALCVHTNVLCILIWRVKCFFHTSATCVSSIRWSMCRPPSHSSLPMLLSFVPYGQSVWWRRSNSANDCSYNQTNNICETIIASAHTPRVINKGVMRFHHAFLFLAMLS